MCPLYVLGFLLENPLDQKESHLVCLSYQAESHVVDMFVCTCFFVLIRQNHTLLTCLSVLVFLSYQTESHFVDMFVCLIRD